MLTNGAISVRSERLLCLEVTLWAEEFVVNLLSRVIELFESFVDVLHHSLWPAEVDLSISSDEV